MQEQPVFQKSAFGGFDKKSVISYIYELNNTAREAQERLQGQIDDVTASREQLSATLQGLESRLHGAYKERDSLAAELRDEKARTGELDDLIDSLRAELLHQQDIIREKDEEIGRGLLENDQLRQRNKALEGKRAEVEHASIHIGELLLRTRTESEQLIADAARQAENTMAQTNLQAEAVLLQAQCQAQDMVDSAHSQAGDIVASADDSLVEIMTQFRAFRQELEGVQNQFMSSVSVMQERFSQITGAAVRTESALGSIPHVPHYEYTPVDAQDWTEAAGDNVTFFRSAAEN